MRPLKIQNLGEECLHLTAVPGKAFLKRGTLFKENRYDFAVVVSQLVHLIARARIGEPERSDMRRWDQAHSG